MKERYINSQKLILEQVQKLFPHKNISFTSNDCSMSEKLSKFTDDKSLSHLYLYMIIFILSYHIDN